jgi:phenylacetate-coenzyme A ligase PaaK-like adenylate-forming protein
MVTDSIKNNLDDWVREVIKYHFSNETGSEFWLKKQKELGIDAINEIKTYSDLKKLGFFNEDELDNCNVMDLIPKKYLHLKEKIKVFETGGTKGNPKRIIDYSYRKSGAKWLNKILDLHKFPSSGNWLHIGPTGPHSIGYTISLLAGMRKGICYYIDFDPRWVKKIITKDQDMFDLYIDHICDQSLNILETQQIDFVFTTPKLLETIWYKLELNKYNLKGILSGGTTIHRDLNRIFRTEVLKRVPLAFIYGNSLMGSAPQSIYCHDELWDLVFYPNYPYFILEVVDFDDPETLVEYETRGWIKITSLNKDFFIPNLLERDEGIRMRGNDIFPWDGVAEVRPHENQLNRIIEGIY